MPLKGSRWHSVINRATRIATFRSVCTQYW